MSKVGQYIPAIIRHVAGDCVDWVGPSDAHIRDFAHVDPR